MFPVIPAERLGAPIHLHCVSHDQSDTAICVAHGGPNGYSTSYRVGTIEVHGPEGSRCHQCVLRDVRSGAAYVAAPDEITERRGDPLLQASERAYLDQLQAAEDGRGRADFEALCRALEYGKRHGLLPEPEPTPEPEPAPRPRRVRLSR